MTTTDLITTAESATTADVQPSTARISFRQPVSTAGFIDAAWWPRSRDLTEELPPLFDVLWTAGRYVTRCTYNLGVWDPAPSELIIQGWRVRLGGFASSDPVTIRLTDAWNRERIDILVIAPSTDAATAERALQLAGTAGDPLRAGEILARVAAPSACIP